MNQPMPTPNDHTPSWSLVTEDLIERGEHGVISDISIRDMMGMKKYGTRLQPHNGRDSVRDAYEEAMDLVVYLRNAIEELPPVVPPTLERRNLNRMYQQALNMMCGLRDYQDWKASVNMTMEIRKNTLLGRMDPEVIASREADRKRQERESMDRGHQRLEALRSHQKPQDAPGDVYPNVMIDSAFRSHSEVTGHPESPGNVPSVEVANIMPVAFIPQNLPGAVADYFEEWKKSLSETTLAKFRRAQQLEAERKAGGAESG